MSHPSGSRRQDDDDWGTKVINEFLLPLAKVAPPLILVGLMTVCVIADWDQGWGHVLRQFADILLPLTVGPVLKLGGLTAVKGGRRLQEIFREHVGGGIKWIILRARLIKLQRLLRLFINNFKRIIGKTPAQYAAEIDRP